MPRRPRRRGAARVREPQPAQPRLRDRVRRKRRPRPTTRSSSRCCTAWPSRCTPRSCASRPAACACTRRSASWSPGMAYLVRRLLENTSNESFVRHRFAEGRTLDALVAPPASPGDRSSTGRPRRADRATDPTSPVAVRQRAARRAAPGRRADAPRRRRSGAVEDELGFGVPAPRRRRRGRRPRDEIVSVDPGGFDASCAGARRPTVDHVERRDRDAAAPRGRRGARRRGTTEPRCCSARRDLMRAPARRARRARGASKPASRSPRPTPTCARRSTSASTTAARRSRSAPARRVGQAAGRAQHVLLRAARRRRR